MNRASPVRHGLIGFGAVPAGLVAVVIAGLASFSAETATVSATATAYATGLIPPAFLALYQQAAASCPGFDWTVLAGVGTVESGNGTNDGPSSAGAIGPMQFLPATFAAYDQPVPADPVPTPPGGADPPSASDPTDAIYAAARYLCSLGAGTNPYDALVAYNCGNPGPTCQAVSASYAAEILGIAAKLGQAAAGAGTLGTRVAAYAISQLGVPYHWGGEVVGVGFDCSGLVQWAWAQAGVALPRVAQDQYNTGPSVDVSQLQAGDLVFFGMGPGSVDHVGIYVGDGQMIDAPNPTSVVRYDPIAGFTPAFVGATAPSGA